MEYKILRKNGVQYVAFNKLSEISFIQHGFSTRIGGISGGLYGSLNLGLKTADDEKNAVENIRRFATAVGVEEENLVLSDQVHKDLIKVVGQEDRGKGYLRERDYHGIDGLVTNIPGIPLMTIFADCVPLFFVDPIQKAIGVSHAGWRGTVLKIGKKTVELMVKEYESNPKDILVVIGPSIGQCCYEVDKKVVDEFHQSFADTSTFIMPREEGKFQLNLWEANKIALKEAGILDENIGISNLCTGCNTDLFYSHRKENGKTGRMGAIIQLI